MVPLGGDGAGHGKLGPRGASPAALRRARGLPLALQPGYSATPGRRKPYRMDGGRSEARPGRVAGPSPNRCRPNHPDGRRRRRGRSSRHHCGLGRARYLFYPVQLRLRHDRATDDTRRRGGVQFRRLCRLGVYSLPSPQRAGRLLPLGYRGGRGATPADLCQGVRVRSGE